MLTLGMILTLTGCAHFPGPTHEQQKICMVYVLPGIEGKSFHNVNIARGLVRGGVSGAVQIYDWTTSAGPLGWFVHLANERRNRIEGVRLARRIMHYQRNYPNRPVYLIAHSGGAGVALLATEKLPARYAVEAVILLAGAVSPDRDLSRALERSRRGIWNFHSDRDVAFLVVGTWLFGTVDRKHGPSAGAVGFKPPEHLSDEARELYDAKLHEVAYDKRMVKSGHQGGHAGWARPEFVARWVAPIVLGSEPPTLEGGQPTAGNDGMTSSED